MEALLEELPLEPFGRSLQICLTRPQAQGPSRTCKESKEEEKKKKIHLTPPSLPPDLTSETLVVYCRTTSDEHIHSTASERRGDNFKGVKDFSLTAKAIIWP